LVGDHNFTMTDIILDCDPGHDDAIAMLLAGFHEDIAIKAITTVAGNQTLEKTSVNARRMLTLMERDDIPVAAGMDEPLVRSLTVADHVHGESGLDGPELPEPEVGLDDRHGVDLIIETIRERDESISIVPVGPLTNIAMALKKAPAIKNGIDQIILMGGGITRTNYTPAAEFNIFVDPEAARLVFESGIDVTMIGLDVTFESQILPEEVDQIRRSGEIGTIVAGFLDYAAQYYQETHDLDGYPVHDAVAVGHLAEGVVDTERMRVDIETESEFCDGRTVCDIDGRTGRQNNADVGVGLDRDAFLNLLFEAIESYR
ncbi:MAG: nucleoside hydrolase, partial [Halobacteriaceae archaeon]